MEKDKFSDFAMRLFFSLILGVTSLAVKILFDIETNIKDLTGKVSLITSYSERHEKQIESIQGYNMVLQRIESELSFHQKQIEALQTPKH